MPDAKPLVGGALYIPRARNLSSERIATAFTSRMETIKNLLILFSRVNCIRKEYERLTIKQPTKAKEKHLGLAVQGSSSEVNSFFMEAFASRVPL